MQIHSFLNCWLANLQSQWRHFHNILPWDLTDVASKYYFLWQRLHFFLARYEYILWVPISKIHVVYQNELSRLCNTACFVYCRWCQQPNSPCKREHQESSGSCVSKGELNRSSLNCNTVPTHRCALGMLWVRLLFVHGFSKEHFVEFPAMLSVHRSRAVSC